MLLVIAMVLGVAGVLTGGALLVRHVTQSREQAVASARATNQWVAKLPGAAEGYRARQIQAEWLEAIVARQWESRTELAWLAACNMVLSAGLLMGAAGARRGRERARRLLRMAAWGHMPYQLVHTAVTVGLSLSMASLHEVYIPRLVAASSSGPANDVVAKATQVGQYVSVVVAVVLAMALAAFYLTLALLSTRARIESLLSR